MDIKTIWDEWKVTILGCFAAIVLLVWLLTSGRPLNGIAVGTIVIVAVVSYFAKNYRGQWPSIFVLVGICVATWLAIVDTGTVAWIQIVLEIVIGYLGLVAPGLKTRGYEHAAPITQAKVDGEKIYPTGLTETE